jgi:tetratricopeptide (TPR) repeat protein
MAAILELEGKYEEAENLYSHVLKKTTGKSAMAYWNYICYLQGRYAAARQRNDGSASEAGAKLIENMENLYRLNKDPMMLYRSGQLAIALGRCEDALRLFTEAGKAFPVQSEYNRFSTKLADGLASGRCRQEHI